MATKTQARQEMRAAQVERELPPLPPCELPTIRGLLVNVNVRESVVYATVRYADPTSRSKASTLSLKTWDVSLGEQLASLPENADVIVEFSPRNSQNKDGSWERWNYLSAIWI